MINALGQNVELGTPVFRASTWDEGKVGRVTKINGVRLNIHMTVIGTNGRLRPTGHSVNNVSINSVYVISEEEYQNYLDRAGWQNP